MEETLPLPLGLVLGAKERESRGDTLALGWLEGVSEAEGECTAAVPLAASERVPRAEALGQGVALGEVLVQELAVGDAEGRGLGLWEGLEVGVAVGKGECEREE